METKPAPFQPSRLPSKTQSQFRLIKVPQFVADQWNETEDQTIVANIELCPKTKKIILKTKIDDVDSGFEFELQTSQPTEISVLQKCPNNSKYADLIQKIENTHTFTPIINSNYLNLIKERNRKLKAENERPAKIETGVISHMENDAMLFQYYQPKDHQYPSSTSEHYKYGPEKRVTGKKTITMDQDSVKMMLFKMFEEAAEEGLQLKQIVKATGQPQFYLKSIIEVIAEPKKRASDRKVVYFLKDWFRGFTNTDPDEDVAVKKLKKM